MKRQNITSASPWEGPVGFSRAVRIGQQIFVSGTVGTDSDGRAVHPTDVYLQAKRALERIGAALNEAGATFSDVVRTRIYVLDISRWEEVARAHGEVFADIRPATSMIEVRNLIGPDLLVEIEADAIMAD